MSAKRSTTWEKLKTETYKLDLKSISAFLITAEEVVQRETEKEIETSNVDDELQAISRISELGIRFWDGLKIYIQETNKHKDLEFGVWDLIKALRSQKRIDGGALRAGNKVIALISSNELDVDNIKTLSKLDEIELVDVKAIYDRMKLLSKDEWARIYALSSQKSIFSNLESANVKSVQRSIAANEKINSQLLMKAHESLQKLSRFGIKY